MKDTITERLNKAIGSVYRDQYDAGTIRLINAATFSVVFGPVCEGEEVDGDGWVYPGDNAAYDKIVELYHDLPTEVWVEGDNVMERKPHESYEDEETGEMIEYDFTDTYYVEKRDIGCAVFGRAIMDNMIQCR